MIKAVVQARVASGRLFGVQVTTCQRPADRRDFSSATINLTGLLKPSSQNISAMIRPISASQISFRCLSSGDSSVVPLDDVATTAVTSLSEPTFHSLGLAHHYPSGWVQAIMEQIHLQFELPWWATIVISKLSSFFLIQCKLTLLPLELHRLHFFCWKVECWSNTPPGSV